MITAGEFVVISPDSAVLRPLLLYKGSLTGTRLAGQLSSTVRTRDIVYERVSLWYSLGIIHNSSDPNNEWLTQRKSSSGITILSLVHLVLIKCVK